MPDRLILLPQSSADVVAYYRSQVSQALNERIVTLIRDQYREAHKLSYGLYTKDQAREAAPRLRRAGVESELLKLNDFHGVRSESLKSSASSFFVQLDVGDFTLIAARAVDPDKMIRQAAYRTKIAIRSLQGSLFSDEPIDPRARYYAVILHGSAKGHVDPDFIIVRFPTSDHQTYLEARIDLKQEFGHLFDAPLTPVEQIEDTQVLRVRREQATGADEV